jgi:hypothetical protein
MELVRHIAAGALGAVLGVVLFLAIAAVTLIV